MIVFTSFPFKLNRVGGWTFLIFLSLITHSAQAKVELIKEVKVSDQVMFFDGVKVDLNHTANSTTGYDYVYGNALTPHGDCMKAYKHFVYLTWYRGGKMDRHVMFTRYYMKTGVAKTIEFPHQHTGYNGKWWIGETHNTIAVGICPKDSTIHMLYDMHRNGNITKDNIATEDYLRYSYTETGGATVADEDFTLDRFVNSAKGNYKHLSFNGIDNVTVTKLLTYPAFFTNDEGDLFMKNRFGYSANGRFLFARYDGNKWHGYTDFNRSNASNYGSAYNWGLYGEIKYLNGKIRVGFQRRSVNKTDKYLYQNGIYYAYSDDPTGLNQWKDYKGQEFTRPLADADRIKIAEPGDWVTTTQKDKVYMVSGFDFTITDAGDEHFVCMVKDNQYNVTKKLHTYRKAGDEEFTTEEYSAGSELYAAGNDVYVIGLNGGRVQIVKTEGGTSNFKQVYQNNAGPTFNKGVVYVYDGKVYYYLKESGGSGDKRTTYLQVYDLGVGTTPADTSHYLAFKDLSNKQEIERGSNLTIRADVGSAFTEVSLWLGNTNLGSLTNAPFQWASHPLLTDMTERTYTFKLIAKDAEGATVEKNITIYTPEVFELSRKKVLHISFEDEATAHWETDGNDYGVVPTIVAGTNTRAGSKVMALAYNGNTSGHHVQNIVDKIAVPDQYYFHMIAYTATSDISFGKTYPTAKLGDWAPTPSFTGHGEVLVFERKVTSRQNTKGDSLNCYPRLRSKSQGGACTIYYDDIVLYTDQNETADIEAPTPPSNLAINNAELTWTEGADSLTGITSTLILRTTEPAAEAPLLKPQVAYGTTGLTKVGNWEVIASLPSGSLSYIDSTQVKDENYHYAVVHKDLAYNYSMATMSRGMVNSVVDHGNLSYTCYGLQGSIVMRDLPYHARVTVYTISGVKVYTQHILSGSLHVPVKQGFYIVNISGISQKVHVK